MNPTIRPTMNPSPADDRLARRRTTQRRLVGLLVLVLGVAFLGHVGWQLWGTNWVSRQTHRDLVAEAERAWDDGREPVTSRGELRAVVRIPKLGDDYAVPVLEGTDDDVLAAGFGHYRGTAGPGEEGNYVIAAHRVTHGEPLRRMPELEAGDTVVIDTAEVRYTYELTSGGDDLVVPFTENWVLADLPSNPDGDGVQPSPGGSHRLLTLVTCAEIFHTRDRMVAFGRLVSQTARPRG